MGAPDRFARRPYVNTLHGTDDEGVLGLLETFGITPQRAQQLAGNS